MSYGSLYSGTVSRLITLTNGQTTVSCSGTVLTEEDLRALDTLAVGTGQVVKLASITDDETFDLLRPWAGTTQTLIATWDIIRDAPSRLDQVDAASAMTQAAGFAALVNGQTRQFRVESEGNGPPGSPVDGKYYLAGSAPSGWPIPVTAGDIVKRRLGSYGVITPEEGWLAVILATGAVKRFKSGAWGVAAVTAADVAFTPTGGVAATTVQGAIAEVDSEKASGPASSTDNAIARFDTTTGKLLQNSVVTVSDAGAVSGVDSLNIGTGTADNPLVMEKSQNSALWARFRNTNAGASATVGLLLGGDGSAAQASIFVNSNAKTDFGGLGSINIGNYGAAGVGFFTNNIHRGGFLSTGEFRVYKASASDVVLSLFQTGVRDWQLINRGTTGVLAFNNGSADLITFDPLTGAAAFTGSLTVGTGGAFGAGSIYSDANWGMLFRAKQASPAQADFAWQNSAGTELARLAAAGIRIGGGATIGAKFDGGVHNVSQTAPVFSARGTPNAFEWGHQNAAGYANTFGFFSSSGQPYIVFNGEAGSTVINTIRTRGVKARGVIGDNAGGMGWFTVANANADDQTVVTDMKLTSGGDLAIGGTSANLAGVNRAATLQATTSGHTAAYELASAGSLHAYFAANNSTARVMTNGALPLLFGVNNTETFRTSGSLATFIVPVKLPSYTVGTVPSASTLGAGTEIYVTNETGGAVTAFSDGTNWRRVTDRAVIS